MQKACEMHAFCCNDTIPVKTATNLLHTVCILLPSLILNISGSVWGAFVVRSSAFGVGSHKFVTRAGIFSAFRVNSQVLPLKNLHLIVHIINRTLQFSYGNETIFFGFKLSKNPYALNQTI